MFSGVVIIGVSVLEPAGPAILKIENGKRCMVALMGFVVYCVLTWHAILSSGDFGRVELVPTMGISRLYLQKIYDYPLERFDTLKCSCAILFPVDQLEEYLKDFRHNTAGEIKNLAHKWIDDYIERMNIIHEKCSHHEKECSEARFSDVYLLKLVSAVK